MSLPIRIFLTGLLVCLCSAPASSAQDTTVVRRAAFDIGSAVIKCTIADVDIPTGHIVKTIETLSEKVDFAEDLARSYDNNLSKDIMAQGIAVMKKLKTIAEQHATQDIPQWAARFSRMPETGVPTSSASRTKPASPPASFQNNRPPCSAIMPCARNSTPRQGICWSGTSVPEACK